MNDFLSLQRQAIYPVNSLIRVILFKPLNHLSRAILLKLLDLTRKKLTNSRFVWLTNADFMKEKAR